LLEQASQQTQQLLQRAQGSQAKADTAVAQSVRVS